MVAAIIQQEADLQKLASLAFQRLVYLGSGVLAGLTQEAQLKILELTAGKIATVYDSSMGFRHGQSHLLMIRHWLLVLLAMILIREGMILMF